MPDETDVTRFPRSNSPVVSTHQQSFCPRGAEVCSQGREPLGQVPPGPSSPEGAAESLVYSRAPVAPLGLNSQCGMDPRGSRPWLNTFAPAGAVCDEAFGESRLKEVGTRREMLSVMGRAAAGLALLPAGATAFAADARGKDLIRVGIIGAGNRSRVHIAQIAALPDRCRITAVCDIEIAKAEAALRKTGPDVRPFSSHAEMLAAKVCDAVVIATPNYTHKQIAIDSLKAGCHVLCEKPMATTIADAKEIVDLVHAGKKVFAVGLQFRHAAIYRKVRELVASKAIGDLKYIWAEEFRGDWARLFTDPQENARRNWRYYQKLSGGTLLEKNCHDFDILGWVIGGKPIRVTAAGGNSVYRDRETLDHASVTVDYENGVQLALGVCMFSKVQRDQTTLVGTEGIIEFPRGGNELTIRRPKPKLDETLRFTEQTGDEYGHRGTRELHLDFLEAIRTGRAPLTDVKVGYEAMQVALAAEEGIRKHQVMEFKQAAS
jgi:predicted dehydrogenase